MVDGGRPADAASLEGIDPLGADLSRLREGNLYGDGAWEDCNGMAMPVRCVMVMRGEICGDRSRHEMRGECVRCAKGVCCVRCARRGFPTISGVWTDPARSWIRMRQHEVSRRCGRKDSGKRIGERSSEARGDGVTEAVKGGRERRP